MRGLTQRQRSTERDDQLVKLLAKHELGWNDLPAILSAIDAKDSRAGWPEVLICYGLGKHLGAVHVPLFTQVAFGVMRSKWITIICNGEEVRVKSCQYTLRISNLPPFRAIEAGISTGRSGPWLRSSLSFDQLGFLTFAG
jgi:hypothetical protein